MQASGARIVVILPVVMLHSAPGTQQLEVEQEELLQDELLKREYGEEWVMLEEEADEETYHSEEGEEHDELNEQCMMNHVG